MAVRGQRMTIPIDDHPAVVDYEIAGHSFRLKVWSEALWARLPLSKRPPDARRLEGVGWVELKPRPPLQAMQEEEPAG